MTVGSGLLRAFNLLKVRTTNMRFPNSLKSDSDSDLPGLNLR